MPFLPLEDFSPVTIYILLFITLLYYICICHMTNYHKLSGLKYQKLIASQFL